MSRIRLCNQMSEGIQRISLKSVLHISFKSTIKGSWKSYFIHKQELSYYIKVGTLLHRPATSWNGMKVAVKWTETDNLDCSAWENVCLQRDFFPVRKGINRHCTLTDHSNWPLRINVVDSKPEIGQLSYIHSNWNYLKWNQNQLLYLRNVASTAPLWIAWIFIYKYSK